MKYVILQYNSDYFDDGVDKVFGPYCKDVAEAVKKSLEIKFGGSNHKKIIEIMEINHGPLTNYRND